MFGGMRENQVSNYTSGPCVVTYLRQNNNAIRGKKKGKKGRANEYVGTNADCTKSQGLFVRPPQEMQIVLPKERRKDPFIFRRTTAAPAAAFYTEITGAFEQ